MKKTLFATALVLTLTLAKVAHAQLGGCDDSPENPTLILAGLAAGAFTLSSIRNRARARRARKQ